MCASQNWTEQYEQNIPNWIDPSRTQWVKFHFILPHTTVSLIECFSTHPNEWFFSPCIFDSFCLSFDINSETVFVSNVLSRLFNWLSSIFSKMQIVHRSELNPRFQIKRLHTVKIECDNKCQLANGNSFQVLLCVLLFVHATNKLYRMPIRIRQTNQRSVRF